MPSVHGSSVKFVSGEICHANWNGHGIHEKGTAIEEISQ